MQIALLLMMVVNEMQTQWWCYFSVLLCGKYTSISKRQESYNSIFFTKHFSTILIFSYGKDFHLTAD